MSDDTKVCTGCAETKVVTEFSRRRDRGPTGRVSKCKRCVQSANLQRTDQQKEEARIRTAKWRKDNPDKAKLSATRSNIKARNGISLEEYAGRHASQDGLCAICSQPSPQLRAVGPKLVCVSCETGMYSFNCDISLLKKALEILDGT